MAVTVFVQNDKALRALAKLRKFLQQDNVFTNYKSKRYFMTNGEIRRAAVAERVYRSNLRKMMQERNISENS